MGLSVGTKFGAYEVLEPIGSGGQGEVYRARDSKLDRDVAIKVLPSHLAVDESARTRFEREAKAVAALSHPNILSIFDFGKHDDVLFAVTELLEGETLRERLSSGPLSARKAIGFASQMAGGLAAAHDKGIVHRDLKPENVFVTDDGRVKILDFGLAWRAEEATDDVDEETPTEVRHTTPGAVMGTVGYMSPEQVRGQTADHRSDIFSLGAILHEMLSGVRTFRRDTSVETMNAILKEEAPALSAEDLPPALGPIVRRCLEKKPGERFQSARDLGFALEALSGETLSAGLAEQFGKKWLAPTLLAVVALVATGLWWLRSDAPAPATESAELEPSIAVLPFIDLSPDGENEYFGDGMAEELISTLSRIDGLKVAARTSSFTFKGRSEDIRTIGEELNVETVLAGSVRRSGNRVRISVELNNVSDGFNLWSEQYDRELDDIFAVQEEIAISIADRLKVTLVGLEPPTENVEAYDLYLKGRFFWARRGEGLNRARDFLGQALAIDPDFALAHAGLADVYSLLGFYGGLRPEESMPQAKAAAERALELDDTLAEAHTALAWVLMTYEWDWSRAKREFERAIELDPRHAPAHYWLGDYYAYVERDAEAAVVESELAVAVDPLEPHANAGLGQRFFYAGRYEEAEAQFRNAIELAPTSFFAHWHLAQLFAVQSRLDEAITSAETAVTLSARLPHTLATLARIYVAAGERAKAMVILDELESRARREYVQSAVLARVLEALGRTEEAVALYQRAYEERDTSLAFYVSLALPGRLQALDDPRIVELRSRMGLER